MEMEVELGEEVTLVDVIGRRGGATILDKLNGTSGPPLPPFQ